MTPEFDSHVDLNGQVESEKSPPSIQAVVAINGPPIMLGSAQVRATHDNIHITLPSSAEQLVVSLNNTPNAENLAVFEVQGNTYSVYKGEKDTLIIRGQTGSNSEPSKTSKDVVISSDRPTRTASGGNSDKRLFSSTNDGSSSPKDASVSHGEQVKAGRKKNNATREKAAAIVLLSSLSTSLLMLLVG